MTDAFVLGGVRTPVGRYGGSLSHIRTDDPNRGKKLADRDAALAAHYALADDERLDEFQAPEPTAIKPVQPSTGFIVTRRRLRSNTRP